MFEPIPSTTTRSRIALVLVLALSIFVLGGPSTDAQAVRPLTVVSLTFDDGKANQLAAAAVLSKHEVRGTFFINSGLLGASGYLTPADLDAMKAGGQEIGGHTLDHPDLTTIPADEAKRQICNDRATLLDMGHPVRSFAYPFARLRPGVETIAKNCGYNSARGLGDIAFAGDPDCTDCPFAAALPPVDSYVTAALPQAESDWTLADLQGAVTRAEQKGGWVQFTFHNVCDASANCALNVTPTLLDRFTEWLVQREASRNTVIRTVGDTVGGPVEPPVTAPSPGPGVPGSNAVLNPGMEESDPDGSPTCWMKGGYGENKAALDRPSSGRTGSRAGRVTMSKHDDGDAKWLQQLDGGRCSPAVVAGKTYSLRQWYTATELTQFDVYLRDKAGRWHYWTSSPWFAAASVYTQAIWTTPTIPVGMSGLSFGLNLFANGTLVTDDAEMYESVAAPDAPSLISSRMELPTDAEEDADE